MGADEALFQELVARGESRILKFVADGQHETEFLDFKNKASHAVPGANSDDKGNLGKALSGFSNTEGGIIIWGVDARKGTGGGPDVAQAVRPFPDSQRFMTDLAGLTGQLVEPHNVGVKHHHILSTNAGQGYVVSLIPGSDLPPHRNLSDGRYYIRTGDGFHRMTHSMLQDAFGSRRRPSLDAGLVPRQDGFVLTITNNGRHAALHPGIRVEVHRDFRVSSYGVDGNRNWLLPPVPQTGERQSAEGTWFAEGQRPVVIHPGMTAEVAVFEFANSGSKWPSKYTLLLNGGHVVRARCELYAEGMEARKQDVTISAREVLQFAPN